MTLLRVGVIGCGLIAQVVHLPNLRDLSDRFEIAAICDLSPTVLNQVGDKYDVSNRTTDWQEVIAQPLDAIMVLTPGSHAPAAIAAARAGHHVFVEKPLCLHPAEGREMLLAAESARITLMVGYMRRYDPAYERLHEHLGNREELRLVRVTTLESPFEPYVGHYGIVQGNDAPAETLQRLKVEDDRRIEIALGPVSPLVARTYRAVLLDSLIHELNAVRGLLGEPDGIEFGHIWSGGILVTLSFGSARCVLQWVDLPGIARYQQEFAFYAPGRRATLRFPSPYLRTVPAELIVEGGENQGTHSWATEETLSYDSAFRRELIEFHDCVIGRRTPRTNGEDALRDVILCGEIIAAAVKGSHVENDYHMESQKLRRTPLDNSPS